MAPGPKSIILTNWPTTAHSSPDQQVEVHAEDASTPTIHPSPNHLSHQDLYHIAFLLRQKLVPDLVPCIMHHAALFSTSSIHKIDPLAVPRGRSPRIYLITPPIHTRVSKRNPVAKVSFRILANHWGLELSIGHSGFTAGILRDEPDDLAEWDGFYTWGTLPLRDERKVVNNSEASTQTEVHFVEWRADSGDAEEAAWVKSLRERDRIAVKAWSRWSSFENRVYSVDVSVHSVAVVR